MSAIHFQNSDPRPAANHHPANHHPADRHSTDHTDQPSTDLWNLLEEQVSRLEETSVFILERLLHLEMLMSLPSTCSQQPQAPSTNMLPPSAPSTNMLPPPGPSTNTLLPSQLPVPSQRLKCIEELMARSVCLKGEKMGELACRLARESIFREEVMAVCTVQIRCKV